GTESVRSGVHTKRHQVARDHRNPRRPYDHRIPVRAGREERIMASHSAATYDQHELALEIARDYLHAVKHWKASEYQLSVCRDIRGLSFFYRLFLALYYPFLGVLILGGIGLGAGAVVLAFTPGVHGKLWFGCLAVMLLGAALTILWAVVKAFIHPPCEEDKTE